MLRLAASSKSIDWGQVGKEAAVGAVVGAVSALVGPEAGPLVRAAVDTGVAVGSQVATKALNGKPVGDGVLMVGAIGHRTPEACNCSQSMSASNPPVCETSGGWCRSVGAQPYFIGTLLSYMRLEHEIHAMNTSTCYFQMRYRSLQLFNRTKSGESFTCCLSCRDLAQICRFQLF